MSRQEKANFVEMLRNALQSYRGFTQIEKNYAHLHLPEWIGPKGELDIFIKKFAENFSIDVRPFLFEKKILSS
jgi:hypothetical protein